MFILKSLHSVRPQSIGSGRKGLNWFSFSQDRNTIQKKKKTLRASQHNLFRLMYLQESIYCIYSPKINVFTYLRFS